MPSAPTGHISTNDRKMEVCEVCKYMLFKYICYFFFECTLPRRAGYKKLRKCVKSGWKLYNATARVKNTKGPEINLIGSLIIRTTALHQNFTAVAYKWVALYLIRRAI